MRSFVLIIAIVISFSNSLEAQTMADSLRVIFPAHTPAGVPATQDFSKRFSPSARDIDLTDSLIKIYLRDKPLDRLTAERFGLYYRQYAGNMQGGQNFIYIIGSCDRSEYFKDRFGLFVRGGGSCYFVSIVSLLTRKVEKFQINALK